jgi:hypothetical protein
VVTNEDIGVENAQIAVLLIEAKYGAIGQVAPRPTTHFRAFWRHIHIDRPE